MKEFISWDLVDECVLDIAEYLIRTGIEFDGVYGIPRGGVILAVMLSHKLDIPYIVNIDRIYVDNCIIIDDITDTGKTLEHYKNSKSVRFDIKKTYFVTIHEHEQTSVKPDYSILYKEDKWIVYPWEIEDSEEVQDYLK